MLDCVCGLRPCNKVMIRLNDNGRHPNPLIYFVKPLVRSNTADLEIATDTLNRLAAVITHELYFRLFSR